MTWYGHPRDVLSMIKTGEVLCETLDYYESRLTGDRRADYRTQCMIDWLWHWYGTTIERIALYGTMIVRLDR